MRREVMFDLFNRVTRAFSMVQRGWFVSAVKYSDPPRVKLKRGDTEETDWIPWRTGRAGEDKSWNPPSTGESAVVFAPFGRTAMGWAEFGFYTKSNPAPSHDPDLRLYRFADNVLIQHNVSKGETLVDLTKNTGLLTIKTAAGDIKATADKFIITGNVSIVGDLNVSQAIKGASVADDTRTMEGDRAIHKGHRHKDQEGRVTTTPI